LRVISLYVTSSPLTLPPLFLLTSSQLQYTELIIWGIIILILKITILLQYLCIFVPNGTRGLIFWTCHAVLWFNVTYYVVWTLLELFSCQPREKFWDHTIMRGHYMDIFASMSRALQSVCSPIF
jgi:hypothetical protein